MHDMPLVIFTLLSQIAVGALVALLLFGERLPKKQQLTAGIVVFVISVAATLVSLLHLGHPLAAYRALLNLGESWLSREVFAFAIFMGLVMIYIFFIYQENQKMGKISGVLGAIVGGITIFSSAKIYMIAAVPAWDSMFTLLFFFATALVGGLLLVCFTKENLFDFSLYGAVTAIVLLVLNGVYPMVLSGGTEVAVSAQNMIMASPLFWVKMGLTAVALGICGFVKVKGIAQPQLMMAVFALLAVAEFVGRMLFYASGIHL